jgi:Mrp family chromosome partitioning ATPase
MKSVRASGSPAASLLEELGRRQLLVVTGKGGVGKSVVAATLGRLLARDGRRVLLLEVDPRESLHQLLGVDPSGGEVVEAGGGLSLQNLPPRHVLDDVVREHLRLAPLVRRVLGSPVYHHFVDGAPGLKELAVLGHVQRLVRGWGGRRRGHTDLVVLDAPATGHSVSLLAAPRVTVGVIPHGPFGHMATELADLVADPVRCGVVAVTLAEEMPVQETIELLDLLRGRLSRDPQLVVVNGLYPRLAPRRQVASRQNGAGLAVRRRSVNDAELARLREHWQGPLAELPMLPLDRGRGLVSALAPLLEAALAKTADGRP